MNVLLNSMSFVQCLHVFINFCPLYPRPAKTFKCFSELSCKQHTSELITCTWFVLRVVMRQLEPNAIYGILDEIVFKISASEESTLGR